MGTATAVEALGPGDHACLTFSDPDERLDLVAAFVLDGLRRSTKVMCLTESLPPQHLRDELTDRGVPAAGALPANQLTVYSSEESWLRDGEFNGASMVDLIAGQMLDAEREGFAGLRLTADMCWVSRPTTAAAQLPVFESEVGKLFADGQLTAICQYDRDVFDAVTLAFMADAHPRAVAAAVYYEDPVLRICRQHSPPGVRVAGEIDHTHVDELTVALAEALRLDQDFQVNLGKLRFLDAAAATAITQAALALPAGRAMTIRCGGEALRLLRLIGTGDVPGVRLLEVPRER